MSHVNVIRRLDGIDASEVKDMLESHAWALYRQKLEAILASECKRLETTDSIDDLRRLQGGISMLRTVLTTPDRLLETISNQIRQEKHRI